MSDYKLTYFDFDGGRGEPIRIAFHIAGLAFEDNRISFPEFSEMRRGVRFNSLPVLEIDDAAITQSNALSRYVGKVTGLYPADHLQALYCDEVPDGPGWSSGAGPCRAPGTRRKRPSRGRIL